MLTNETDPLVSCGGVATPEAVSLKKRNSYDASMEASFGSNKFTKYIILDFKLLSSTPKLPGTPEHFESYSRHMNVIISTIRPQGIIFMSFVMHIISS